MEKDSKIRLSDGIVLNAFLAVSIAENFCDGKNYQNQADILLAWSFIGKNGLSVKLQDWYSSNLKNLVHEGILDENYDIVIDYQFE